MRRRSGTSDEKVKAQRRKAATPKRRKGPKAARRRGSAAAGQETKVAFLIRELSQAVEQQAATAKVLQIISSSTFDLQTVLNALVEAGMHLCEADVAAIWRPENGVLKLAATSGMSNEFVEFAKQNPIMPGRGTVSGRVVLKARQFTCQTSLPIRNLPESDTSRAASIGAISVYRCCAKGKQSAPFWSHDGV